MSMKTKKLELSEYGECLLVVDYLNILISQGKITAYTHIPNETYTKSWSAKRRNTALGVKRGFPDYVIIGKRFILFLEMKKRIGGVVSPEQKAWLDALGAHESCFAAVAKGFDEAKLCIDELLLQSIT